jgi:hypothetical protein
MANLTALLIGFAIASGSPVDSQVQTANARPIDFDAVVLQMSHSCAAPPACALTIDCCPSKCETGATSCCDPCSTCSSSCVDGYCCGSYCCGNWCGSCWGCPQHCWSKDIEWTTSDLYPHFAYFPEEHGYYSFRPYNWLHIEQAKSAFPGIDPKAPFSNKFITEVQDEFIKTNGPGPLALGSDQARDIRVRLPNVEDILNSGK